MEAAGDHTASANPPMPSANSHSTVESSAHAGPPRVSKLRPRRTPAMKHRIAPLQTTANQHPNDTRDHRNEWPVAQQPIEWRRAPQVAFSQAADWFHAPRNGACVQVVPSSLLRSLRAGLPDLGPPQEE